MHASLQVRWNVAVIIACVVFAAVMAVFTHPFPLMAWVAAAAFGVVSGLLQARAVVEARSTFQSAATMLEVRAALTSTASGRRSLYVQWALLPVLLVVAFLVHNTFGAALGGYAVFMAVRDAIALRTVGRLNAKSV